MKLLYLPGPHFSCAAVIAALTALGATPSHVSAQTDPSSQWDTLAISQATKERLLRILPLLPQHVADPQAATVAIAQVIAMLTQLAPAQVICAPLQAGPATSPAAWAMAQASGIPLSFGGETVLTAADVALAAAIADDFAPPQNTKILQIGGDSPCQALLLEAEDTAHMVLKMECNLDDMTGEALAYACELLMSAGALDVWTTPITMKKGRPAQMLSVLCSPQKEEALTELLFLHTTTIGIRVSTHRRHVMARRSVTLATPYGNISAKESTYGTTVKCKPEFDDVKKIAEANGLSLAQIHQSIGGSQNKK